MANQKDARNELPKDRNTDESVLNHINQLIEEEERLASWPFANDRSGRTRNRRSFVSIQLRSYRSRFMTLCHAATKSFTNFSLESLHA